MMMASYHMAFSQYEILSEEQKGLHQNENFMSVFVRVWSLCFAPLGLLVVSGHK